MYESPMTTNEKGFTLIEILVVVIILGILIAIAVPVYIHAVSQANRQVVEANLRMIDSTILQYRLINEATEPTENDLADFLQYWPEGPDGVKYDVSESGRAVIANKGNGVWFTADVGASLPIEW